MEAGLRGTDGPAAGLTDSVNAMRTGSDRLSGGGRPAVSVILIAFSRRDYIEGAFRSILAQTVDRSLFEIIVIKNFPSQLIDGWTGEPSVTVVQSPSAAIGESYSLGVRLSRGEIICFLDDDDEYEPTRLARLFELFSTCSGPVYYHNQRTVIDENGKAISGGWAESLAGNQRDELIVFGPDILRGSILPSTFDVYFNESSMALSRQILLNRQRELHEGPELIDIFMVCTAIAENATFILDGRRLTKYRVHGNQVSGWADPGNGRKSVDESNSVINKHIDTEHHCMPLVEGTAVEKIFRKNLPRLVLTNQLYYSRKKDSARLLRNMLSYIRMRNAADIPDMLALTFLSLAYSISHQFPRRFVGAVRR